MKMTQPYQQPTNLGDLLTIHLRFATSSSNNITSYGHKIYMDHLGDILYAIVKTMVYQYNHFLDNIETASPRFPKMPHW